MEDRALAGAEGGRDHDMPLPAVADDMAAGLLEAAPDAILGIDGDGAIALVNAQAELLFGYQRSELIGRPVEVLVPAELRAPHERHRAEYRDQPRVRPMSAGLELRGLRKDGSEFPVEISLSPMSANHDVFVVAIVRDLGERTDIEAELRRTRDRLAEAQRLARLGSWEWDIPNNDVIWSDELFRIYGLRPGETKPSYEEFLERVHPEDRESVDERNRRAFADHQPFEDVKRCVRPDGEVFLMRTQGEVITDSEGNPVRMLGVCEDVTTERRAEEASAMLAAIVRSSADAIVSLSADGTIQSWNPGAARLYGHSEEEALGEHVEILVPPSLRADEEEKIKQVLAGRPLDHYETRRVRKDGSTIDVSLTLSPLGNGDGASAVSMVARDITERKRVEQRLKYLANNDPLTKLYNRHRFEDSLILHVAKARRYGTTGAVLVLDLDNFKYINDTFGHGVGDEVLRSIAQMLLERLRKSDILARLGGDEFAILVPQAGEEEARRIANDLLERFREHGLPIDGHPVRATASIGVTLIDESTSSAEEVLADADRAMYDAKDPGRDRAIVLDARDRGGDRRDGHLGWEHRIREALDKDLLTLHCQPILDLRTDEISQHELLLRMKGPDGLVLPGAFLGVAERLGLIHEIDRWVVTQAIGMLAERPGICLEVNLSGRSVDDEQLLRLIRAELERTEVDASRLILEITETATIASLDQARRFVEALHELGCGFAIDDFGTGFGSFYYLKRIPVEYLKIDGDFVRSPRSQTDDLVVESIVRMAQGLGKRTIAEFVEDGDTLESLRAKGVDFAQGYHVGRPAPAGELGA